MENTHLNFQFDHWQAILLSALPALLNLFIFCYVRLSFTSDKTTKTFSLFLLALIIFQVSDTFIRMSPTVDMAMFWSSTLAIGVLLVTPLGLQFCLLYSGKKKYAESFTVQLLLFAPAVIFSILNFLHKEYIFSPSAFWGWVYKENAASIFALQGYWIGMIGLAMLFILIRHATTTNRKSTKRKQAIIIAITFSIPMLEGIVDEIILPVVENHNSIPLTSAFLTCFSVGILLSLKKYNLFSVTDSLKANTILEAMTDILIILSPDKKIEFINAEGEAALGVFNPGEKEMKIENFFSGGKQEADNFTRKLFIPVLAGEKIANYSSELITISGRTIPVLISATFFKGVLGKPQILLLIHDITDLMEAGQQLALREEQLKDKTDELNSFFYRTTHDLKGPIASIIGLTRLAKKEPDENTMAMCFDKIETSASRLDNILLDFIKVMHIKERTPEVVPINFHTISDNIIQSIKYSTNRDIVNFHVWIEPGISFYSDENLFDSILYNLIANAVNYRKMHADADPFVHVQVRSFGNGIMMKVSDNGVGIKKEIQSKIFNLFFRGSQDSKGTGLGLYILKNATAKLNGRVELESEINKGTTFTVYLPDMKSEANVENLLPVYASVS
jgi:signal transduction histidine kinase